MGKLYKKELLLTTSPVVNEEVNLWISENFSAAWFNDALKESKIINDQNARRREIIFAVCFSETYLFEWTRNIVGVRNILNYFPVTQKQDKKRHKRSLLRSWQEIPQELFNDTMIQSNPKINLRELNKLINYRNGFIHAHASRPITENLPEEEKPCPTKAEVEGLPSGWALKMVVDIIKDLHQELNSAAPYFILDAFPDP
jgi:hypothetical protein